jgi:hypothetical protein
VERRYYHLIEVVVVINVWVRRAKAGAPEEIVEVNNQENQDDRAQNAHVARGPLRVLLSLPLVVAVCPCAFVADGQYQRLVDVEAKAQYQSPLDGANDGVVTHEMRVGIECYPIVVAEKLEVSHQVHHQERAKKQARKGHNNLAPDAASEGFYKPIHSNLNQKRSYLSRPKVGPKAVTPKNNIRDACYLERLNIT